MTSIKDALKNMKDKRKAKKLGYIEVQEEVIEQISELVTEEVIEKPKKKKSKKEVV